MQRGFLQLSVAADLSSWSKVLKELGHLEVLLLGIELPLETCPPSLRAAADKIREAHQDLVGGRWDAAVRNIRLAMDVAETIVPYTHSRGDLYESFARKESRDSMGRRARADLVRLAIRHCTHLSHHLDPATGVPALFNRYEATFIVAAAAASLMDAIEMLHVRTATTVAAESP